MPRVLALLMLASLQWGSPARAATPEEPTVKPAMATVVWDGKHPVSLKDEEGGGTLCVPPADADAKRPPCSAVLSPGLATLRVIGAKSGFDDVLQLEMPAGAHLFTLSRRNEAAMVATIVSLGVGILGGVLWGVGLDLNNDDMALSGGLMMPIGALSALVAGVVWASDRTLRVDREPIVGARF